MYPLRWPTIIWRARRRNHPKLTEQTSFSSPSYPASTSTKDRRTHNPNDHSFISPHPHPYPANVIHPLPSSGRTNHATRKEGKKYSVDPWLGVIRSVPRHSSACARRRTERTNGRSKPSRRRVRSSQVLFGSPAACRSQSHTGNLSDLNKGNYPIARGITTEDDRLID